MSCFHVPLCLNKTSSLCVVNRYLIKFLSKLTEHQEMNKMTPGNIAIVLGPNLLWMNNEGFVFIFTVREYIRFICFVCVFKIRASLHSQTYVSR